MKYEKLLYYVSLPLCCQIVYGLFNATHSIFSVNKYCIYPLYPLSGNSFFMGCGSKAGAARSPHF